MVAHERLQQLLYRILGINIYFFLKISVFYGNTFLMDSFLLSCVAIILLSSCKLNKNDINYYRNAISINDNKELYGQSYSWVNKKRFSD